MLVLSEAVMLLTLGQLVHLCSLLVPDQVSFSSWGFFVLPSPPRHQALLLVSFVYTTHSSMRDCDRLTHCFHLLGFSESQVGSEAEAGKFSYLVEVVDSS